MLCQNLLQEIKKRGLSPDKKCSWSIHQEDTTHIVCKIIKYSTFYLQENDIIAFEIVFVEIKWNIYEMLGKVTDSHSSSKSFWM